MPDPRLAVVVADITTLDVDAIVNAANQALAGGGGVDGAIHRAAGAHDLHAACAALGGCPTGDAKTTPGFRLKARWIVHAVGPRYREGAHGEPSMLASAYRRALEEATAHGARSVAFPAIATGVYGYPADAAAAIAVETIDTVLRSERTLERVVLCAFSEDQAAPLRAALAREPR